MIFCSQVNHYPTPNTQYNVTGLSEGNRYEFRVVAVNEAGPGKPSRPSDAIVAKVPKCECLLLIGSYIET